MIKLTKATVHKYKSIENEQEFSIETDVTVLVGMNESGKTSLLEALAKVNYFEEDDDFSFNMTHDFPRKQKKAADKSGNIPNAVTLEYELSESLAKDIANTILLPIDQRTITYTKSYDNKGDFSILCNIPVKGFTEKKLAELGIKELKYVDAVSAVKSGKEFDALVSTLSTQGESAEFIETIKKIRVFFTNNWNWENPIEEYITRVFIDPNLPKFMYYDDYYMLPSRISIDKINKGEIADSSQKTARALLELAEIDTSNILEADSYEDFKAELEATQAIISDELFKYWSTNQNLKINFDIDKIEKTDSGNNRRIVDHVLDIRVQNTRSGVSLPLKNRSKGFNWFFSFLVWFKKIQEDHDNTYVLLLDEPGLSLHAMAQHDLLRFIKDLSAEYQIIYSTHSPFMIDTNGLHQVRTVVEKTDGTRVSDCLQEKDPNTLFPLQAALGYTLAQNLFVSPKNLVVEGIADLTYINVLSNLLLEAGREGLKSSITIVPVGGADKVSTFISLLRGNELGIVCLLDTFTDQSAKARLDSLVAQNIIKDKKVIFYHEILSVAFADVEDLFTDKDFLLLYNNTFAKKVTEAEIDSEKPIMTQLKKLNNSKDFNHFSPASYLAKNITTVSLDKETLNNFEAVFKKVNMLL